MDEPAPVRLTKFEDQPASLFQDQSIHVGQIKLQVRLAGDMDEKFLERLDHILKQETPC
jgi:hypothetical protein